MNTLRTMYNFFLHTSELSIITYYCLFFDKYTGFIQCHEKFLTMETFELRLSVFNVDVVVVGVTGILDAVIVILVLLLWLPLLLSLVEYLAPTKPLSSSSCDLGDDDDDDDDDDESVDDEEVPFNTSDASSSISSSSSSSTS